MRYLGNYEDNLGKVVFKVQNETFIVIIPTKYFEYAPNYSSYTLNNIMFQNEIHFSENSPFIMWWIDETMGNVYFTNGLITGFDTSNHSYYSNINIEITNYFSLGTINPTSTISLMSLDYEIQEKKNEIETTDYIPIKLAETCTKWILASIEAEEGETYLIRAEAAEKKKEEGLKLKEMWENYQEELDNREALRNEINELETTKTIEEGNAAENGVNE